MAAARGQPLVTHAEDSAVSMAGMDQALALLGRQAHAHQDGEAELQAGITRACLWNLAVHVPNPRRKKPGPAEEGDALHDLLSGVSRTVPARILRLEEWSKGKPQEKGREVEAFISTVAVQNSSGGWQVCGEVVNLAAFQGKGPSHFPTLVRALLVPQLPLALLWLDEMPRKGRLLGQLLRMSDRILVDSQHGGDEDALCLIKDLMAVAPITFYDLGWMRLSPVRQLVASFFDPPGMAARLSELDRVELHTSTTGRTTGLLLLGWLLSRCGYTRFRAVDLGEPSRTHYRWNVARGNRWFLVDFHVEGGDGGLDGLISLELQAGDDRFFIEDVDAEHMRAISPTLNKPRVPLHVAGDQELIITGLAGRAKDPVFVESLGVAADLVESEQWNQ